MASIDPPVGKPRSVSNVNTNRANWSNNADDYTLKESVGNSQNYEHVFTFHSAGNQIGGMPIKIFLTIYYPLIHTYHGVVPQAQQEGQGPRGHQSHRTFSSLVSFISTLLFQMTKYAAS